MAEADRLKGLVDQAERRERLDAEEAELRATQGRRSRTDSGRDRRRDRFTAADRKSVIRAWALYGTRASRHDADVLHRAGEMGIEIGSKELSFRALEVGTAEEGGHAVPVNLATEYERQLLYYSQFRSMCRVLTTDTGADLDWVQVADTANKAVIVDEEGGIGSSADPAFAKVTFKAWNWTSPIVKVSIQLLQDSSVDIEALLADLFAERQGRGEEEQFILGDGTTEPLGIAVGATSGVSLDAGNAITGDKLMDWFHTVDLAYRSTGVFAFHDLTAAAIRKAKTGDGQYLWQPGLTAGQPDLLLGRPVLISNSFAAHAASPGDNAVMGVFGSIPRHYMIRDVGPSRVLIRLNELYAATGQVGFLMMQRTDGRIVGHSGCMKALKSWDAP